MISVEGENKQWLCQLHLAEIGKHSPTDIQAVCLDRLGNIVARISQSDPQNKPLQKAQTPHHANSVTNEQHKKLNRYVLIPDPAIRQAHLTADLAKQLDAQLIPGTDWIAHDQPIDQCWGMSGVCLHHEPLTLKKSPSSSSNTTSRKQR